MIEIGSAKNGEFKRLLKLKNAAAARKEGVFLLEGERAVLELPPEWETESLWMASSYHGKLPARLPEQVFRLPDDLFQKAAETVHSQGILAVVRRPAFVLQDLLPERGKTPLWIVLENLQDPGNAGTILRTADACAASGIICTKGTVDFFNSKVIRSCMGSFFHIPFVTVQSIEEAAAFVHENGGMLVGTHLRTSLAYTDVNFRQAAAIVIGNEGSGMSEEAANLCDTLVKIPMPGRAESLNASVAAGVMMYEAVRQRSLKNCQ